MTTWPALADALRHSWSADTSDDPDRWDPVNPARMQCLVSVLVVHDHLGGEVLEAPVLRGGCFAEAHYWLRLPCGTEVDPTGSQFLDGETMGPTRTVVRPEPVPPPWRERYQLLGQRVREHLAARPVGLTSTVTTDDGRDVVTVRAPDEEELAVAVVSTSMPRTRGTATAGRSGVSLDLVLRAGRIEHTGGEPTARSILAAAELACARRAAREGVLSTPVRSEPTDRTVVDLLLRAGWTPVAGTDVLTRVLPGSR